MGQIANEMAFKAIGKAIGKVTDKLFKTKYAKELESYLTRIDTNMANNYKDNAQANLRDFEAALEKYSTEGLLKESELTFFTSQLGIYKERLKGYTHKDQKPYWH